MPSSIFGVPAHDLSSGVKLHTRSVALVGTTVALRIPSAGTIRIDRGRSIAVAILLLAAILRAYNIDADAFWKNELFSMVWMQQSISYLIGEGSRIETNPPLHFLILKAWTSLFGSSEFTARMPSLLAGVAAVGLTIRLGTEVASSKVGLLGGALMAIMPVQIVFAHEARAYGLLPVFALTAMIGANRILRAAERPIQESGHFDTVLFALGCTGLMHSHATGVFAVASLGLTTFVALVGLPGRRSSIQRLILAGGAAGISAAPVLIALAMQSGSDNISWMPKFGLDTLIILNRYLLIGPMVRTDLGDQGSHIELLCEMGLGTLTALILIVTSLIDIKATRPRALLLVFPLLFILLLAAISLERPVLIPRVALWVSAPCCLAAAAVLTGARSWWIKGAVSVLLATCIAIGLYNNVFSQAQHKPDWRALIALHSPTEVEGSVLVAGPHAGPLGVAYYSKLPIARRIYHWTPDETLPTTTADRLERKVSGAAPISTADLGVLITSGRGVVLYLDDDDEILIGKHLATQPWLAAARRLYLPGLILLEW